MALPVVIGAVLVPAVLKLAEYAYDSYNKSSEEDMVKNVKPVEVETLSGSTMGRVAILQQLKTSWNITESDLNKVSSLIGRFKDRAEELSDEKEGLIIGRAEKIGDAYRYRIAVEVGKDLYFLHLPFEVQEKQNFMTFKDSAVYDICQELKHNPNQAKFIELL